MSIPEKDSPPRGVVMLAAFDEGRNLVLEQSLSVVEYYEELHPLLDEENDFRSSRNIRIVVGKIYNYDCNVDQQFENEYDAAGTYVRSRIFFADGTIVEE